jgi:sigma-54 specific flagellar transcriptional regulator A
MTVRLSSAAIMKLCDYTWPGNVRELANVLERLAILHPQGIVDISNLPKKIRGDCIPATENTFPVIHSMSPRIVTTLPAGGIDLKDYLEKTEISLIRQALKEANSVVARAAKLLQMRRTTLVEKMRKYGIERDTKQSME